MCTNYYSKFNQHEQIDAMLLNKRLFEFTELFHECHIVDVDHNWKSKKGMDSDSALYVMMTMMLYDDDLSFCFDDISTVRCTLRFSVFI